MARSSTGPASHKRRKRAVKKARGFRGGRRLLRNAYDAVDKAHEHAYSGRKEKKRNYRRLWTVRINIACRNRGMNYSRFIHGLKTAGIELNRKVLADLAVTDEKGFDALVEQAKAALG